MLFVSMTADEKRKLLKTVLLNPRLNGSNVEFDYHLPFAMFTNVVTLEKWRD